MSAPKTGQGPIHSTVAVSRQDAEAAPAARAIEEGAVRALRNLFGYARSHGITPEPATLKLEVRLTEYDVASFREDYHVRATMEARP